MGGLRAAVGVVLGVISLAVLSLHIALCIHYPSPLFAVTLLLNPSLWLFLGLIGMGCALLLTHRDQQRKVRAGHCASCHPHYGSTMDTKWREQDAKWRGGPHYQRGPSRAIYSYNGNLHKFYASYGTINEKQLIEMKHSNVKSSDANGKSLRSEGTNGNESESSVGDSKTKENSENTRDSLEPNGENNDTSTKGGKDAVDGNNKLADGNVPTMEESKDLGAEDNKSNNETAPEGDSQVEKESESQSSLNSSSNSPGRSSMQELLYRERKYCDCMARYGAIYHYPQLSRSAVPPRCNRYGAHDRSANRYNRKLVMRCKLRPPNETPVELFAAKDASDNKEPGKTTDMKEEDAESKCSDTNKDTGTSQKSAQLTDGDASSAGCTESTSLSSSMAEISAPKESVTRTLHTAISSKFIVPLKHMSRFSTQTSTTPLGSPYNGKSKQAEHLEDHESTSLSSDQTASEQDLQDQDGVSISSKSSLLPSSPEKSVTSKDLARSPIWRPFKSSIIGRKRLSDEDRSSNEDNSKIHHSKGYDSTNEEGQDSPSTTLKSVFTSKRSFTKVANGSRKSSPLHESESNENISSESNSSSASPSLKEKRRQINESPKSMKSKTPSSRKTSSSKYQSLPKNSRTLLLSPAKAVRSLVLRNAQKRTSRVRKAPDEKTQHGDFIPAKLPLLSSPNTERSLLESSIIASQCKTSNNTSASQVDKNSDPTSASDVSTVLTSDSPSTPFSATCAITSTHSSTSPSCQSKNCTADSVSRSPTASLQQGRGLTKEKPSTESPNFFISGSPTVKTPLLSPPATSSTSSAPTATTTTMASSSSPSSSPSVRPKEPKKPKIRLKGKRPRAAESIMLLTADSDD